MKKFPLAKRLRKEYHRKVAYAQDLLVMEIYNVMSEVVLHGGTILWRCYGGNRFSEDIDAIIPVKYRDSDNIDVFRRRLLALGFKEGKFRVKERSIYARFMYSGVEVRFEAVFKDVDRYVPVEYEMVDGTYIYIYTLPVEEILVEKVDAYLSRRLVRDLYDIRLILDHVEDVEKVRNAVIKLVENYIPPIDEENLKLLIISGVAPTAQKLIGEIRRWAGKNI